MSWAQRLEAIRAAKGPLGELTKLPKVGSVSFGSEAEGRFHVSSAPNAPDAAELRATLRRLAESENLPRTAITCASCQHMQQQPDTSEAGMHGCGKNHGLHYAHQQHTCSAWQAKAEPQHGQTPDTPTDRVRPDADHDDDADHPTVRLRPDVDHPTVRLRARLIQIAEAHGIDAGIVRAIATDDALRFALDLADWQLLRWLNIVGTREMTARGMLKSGTWAIPEAADVQP